jgi:hypothetical protein
VTKLFEKVGSRQREEKGHEKRPGWGRRERKTPAGPSVRLDASLPRIPGNGKGVGFREGAFLVLCDE